VFQTAEGNVTQINRGHTSLSATVTVVRSAVDRETVEAVLDALRDYEQYDDDPDTVDGMPTYEMFVDSPSLPTEENEPSIKYRDNDPVALKERRPVRERLQNLTRPYLDSVLTPFVRQRYPEVCNRGNNRDCTPCYSLIRRYRHGERQSHATHYDGHALVTAVVSLSDHGRNYLGGLYVSTGHGQREYLALNKGDAAVHQSTLLHGVQVFDVDDDEPAKTERWSWILWYRDSETCDDFSHEWFAACSDRGDALCQTLHSTKVGQIPGTTEEETATQIMELNRRAALGGSGLAALKMARAYLKTLPSSLPFDVAEAKRYFRMAVESNNPDGHYGLAQLLVHEVAAAEESLGDRMDDDWKRAKLQQAVSHLEAAAVLGHAYSMFNLGMVHTFGYGTEREDQNLAREWFARSGLPEGYFLAAQQAASVGEEELHQKYLQLAGTMGFGQPWRKEARQRTGSGGAGGVDLNMNWPVSTRGIKPPRF
jgi:hypothetical protein